MSEELATGVLDWVATRLDTITSESPDGGFQRSGYRFALGEEPDSGIDGMYFVDLDGIQPHTRDYGRQENRWLATINVDVGYFRGGGDLDGGDRQTVTRNASDDAMLIADTLERTASYDGENTGIEIVKFQGAERIAQTPSKDIWRVRFSVQWRSDWRA